MGVATFIENDFGTETAKALVYNAWWFEAIMVLFVINFFGNIFKFKLWRKEKLVSFVFHLALVLVIVGAGVTRYIGFEGSMPINEGEISSDFLSEKNYLSITIDNGKEQIQQPIEKPLLLSAATKNNVNINTTFRDQPVAIKLLEFIPNAYEVFQQHDSGEAYLHLVESSTGKRKEHYIKKGGFELINGMLIGFETDQNAFINIGVAENQLTINSESEGVYYRMRDQYQGSIAQNQTEQLSLLSVYQIAGLQFVVPEMPVTGTFKTVSDKENSDGLSALTFAIKTNGAEKEVTVKGRQFGIQPPTRITVDNLNFNLNYGAKKIQLPFAIKLNDFQLEKYPGSESPLSFASEVTVYDQKGNFDQRIYMNNILKHRGYKFFQSSYQIDGEVEQTILSVNYDFWGSTLTYWGYYLLYGGLLLTFFVKGNRFYNLKEQLEKIRIKKASLLSLCLLVGFLCHAQPKKLAFDHSAAKSFEKSQIDSILISKKVSENHSAAYERLILQDAGGRMKPVHTFASELLRKVSKKDTYEGLNATQVILSMQQYPRLWFNAPIIYLEKGNRKLRNNLGLKEGQKYAKLIDFFDKKGDFLLYDDVQKAYQQKIKSKYEKDLINIDRRVSLLSSALIGTVFRIYPNPNDPNNTWVTHAQLNTANYEGEEAMAVSKLLPYYLQLLSNDQTANNNQQVADVLNGIIVVQKKYGAAIYPKDSTISLEIAYNKYDIFKKLYSYYLYIGTILFILLIVQVFYFKSRKLSYVINACIAITIALFVLNTLGLISRGIISNHAPWSNAYESMIYVAWSLMLFGLLIGRKSNLTIAAATVLSSFILMVAHWQWMDPAIENLVPVLNSYWLMIHVSIIVFSYAPFALAMILGLLVLLLMIFTNHKNKERIELIISELTIINELSLTVGLVMLTIGNFLGGQWANESWGRYWGWDPKETWALISIMVYSFILHLRLVPGLRSKFVFNVASVVAFASILMTYFGVNFYLSGLHSYAKGDQNITPSFIYYSVGIVTFISVVAYFKNKKHLKL